MTMVTMVTVKLLVLLSGGFATWFSIGFLSGFLLPFYHENSYEFETQKRVQLGREVAPVHLTLQAATVS